MNTLPRVAHVQGPSWQHPWLEDLVTRLPTYGWEPVVISVAPEGPLHASLGLAGITSLALGFRGRSAHPLAALRLVQALRGVEVVHAHLVDAEHVVTLAGLIAPRPVVITRHASPALLALAPLGRNKRILHGAVETLILRRAAAIIAPSRGVRDGLLELGAKASRVHTVLLGVDMERLQRVDLEQAKAIRYEFAPHGGFVALAVGRLAWGKRIEVLLHAWQRLLAVRADALLLVAGEGPQRAELERLAADLGMTGRIVFLGWRRDVHELMLAADAVVHASATESTGLVLLEALALARPLITTPVGIVNEYLTDGIHCMVVPHDDESALANALRHVADEPSGAALMARAGQGIVMRRSAIEPMVAEYAAIYDSLIRRS